MKAPRRQFLRLASGAISAALCGVSGAAQAPKRTMPTPPEPAESSHGVPNNSNAKISQRVILQQHAKEFRDSLTALSERVSELKQEVEQLHSADIFSVKIYKQTSEIEHLAKQLKTLAKS